MTLYLCRRTHETYSRHFGCSIWIFAAGCFIRSILNCRGFSVLLCQVGILMLNTQNNFVVGAMERYKMMSLLELWPFWKKILWKYSPTSLRDRPKCQAWVVAYEGLDHITSNVFHSSVW